MNLTPYFAFALLAAASAQAQIGSIAAANASFDIYGIPDSTSADAPRIRFSADAATANSVAFSYWWYYRIAGDTAESALNSSGGQISDQQFAGNRGVIKWDDVDGRGLRATYVITVHSDSATTGINVHHLTVENTSANPISLELFGYADIDHCGTANGDSAVANGNNFRHTISDPGCPGVDAELVGIRATRYFVGTWPVVLDSLVDATAADLPDTGLPFGPSSDYTAALQWSNPTLAPGESFSVVAAISHGTTYADCAVTATETKFGTAVPGALGAPTLSTTSLPVVGSSAELTFANGPANANTALLYGTTQINGSTGVFVPVIGFDLYINPLGSSPIVLDANGEQRLLLPFPLSSFGLCGVPFFFHVLVSDPTAATPFQLSTTQVVQWTIGQ